MDNATKKFIVEQNEKLAIMVAKGFEQTATKQELQELRQEMSTKSDIARIEGEIVRLEGKVDSGFGKRFNDQDQLRDRMRVLETRVDHLETSKVANRV